MKKIISIFSALAIMFTMAVSVSAEVTEPTISLEVSGGNKAGDTVTVVCKYDGFDVTPYDDAETGSGQKITGVQVRIDIPGGLGTATHNEQFLRSGVTNVSGFATGSSQWNWDMNNNQFTCVTGNIEDPMQPSGTVFTITMTLNKDVTEDLEFDFNSSYEQTIVYDNYTEWTMGDTIQVKNPATVGDTLEAPVVDTKEFDTVVDQAVGSETYNGKYLKHIATVLVGADASKKVSISDGSQTQVSGRTLAEILDGAAVDGSLKVNAKIAIGVLTSDADAVFTFDLVK